VDPARAGVAGSILIIATNCNGGVKEIFWAHPAFRWLDRGRDRRSGTARRFGSC
jgi:hypothetical protein